MAIACMLFFSCYLVVFLLENGMAKTLYKRIHGEMDGYHLKKVLRMIGKGGLNDELAGMAKKNNDSAPPLIDISSAFGGLLFLFEQIDCAGCMLLRYWAAMVINGNAGYFRCGRAACKTGVSRAGAGKHPE